MDRHWAEGGSEDLQLFYGDDDDDDDGDDDDGDGEDAKTTSRALRKPLPIPYFFPRV